MLHHRCLYDFGHKCLGKLADFGMSRDSRSQWAPCTVDNNLVLSLLHLSDTSNGGQNLQGQLNAALKIFLLLRRRAGSYVATDLAENLVYLFFREPPFQDRD